MEYLLHFFPNASAGPGLKSSSRLLPKRLGFAWLEPINVYIIFISFSNMKIQENIKHMSTK